MEYYSDRESPVSTSLLPELLRRDINNLSGNHDIMKRTMIRNMKDIKEAQEGSDHSQLLLEKRISKLEIASDKSKAHRLMSKEKESAEERFMRKYREYFRLDKYSYAPSLRSFITDPPSQVDDIRRYLFWQEYLSKNYCDHVHYAVEEDDDK
jgi:hypothetical protein